MSMFINNSKNVINEMNASYNEKHWKEDYFYIQSQQHSFKLKYVAWYLDSNGTPKATSKLNVSQENMGNCGLVVRFENSNITTCAVLSNCNNKQARFTSSEYWFECELSTTNGFSEIAGDFKYEFSSGIESEGGTFSIQQIGKFGVTAGHTLPEGRSEDNTATGIGAVALGCFSLASGDCSLCGGGTNAYEGVTNVAVNTASGRGAIGWGLGVTASGRGATAFGGSRSLTDGGVKTVNNNVASGNYSFVTGTGNTASGLQTACFGSNNVASKENAIATGTSNTASGYDALTFGYHCTASGDESMANGDTCVASGKNSHAEGKGTIADSDNQHASGKWNIAGTIGAEVVGGGTGNNARANLRVLDWSGNETISGKHYGNGSLVALEDMVITGTTAPSTAPAKVGQMYVNTSAKKVYVACGTSASTDWVAVN